MLVYTNVPGEAEDVPTCPPKLWVVSTGEKMRRQVLNTQRRENLSRTTSHSALFGRLTLVSNVEPESVLSAF
jgi:hypothetical protein